MSKAKPELIEADELTMPAIPDAASQAILAAVAQARAAQQNVQATVGLVLATLGLSLETHDVQIVEGRAVVTTR